MYVLLDVMEVCFIFKIGFLGVIVVFSEDIDIYFVC